MKTGRNISRKADFTPSPPLATSARAAKPQRKDGEIEGGSATGVWTVRQQGLDIGRYLAVELGGKLYAADEISGPTNREAFSDRFHEHGQWVLIMTPGVAVRY